MHVHERVTFRVWRVEYFFMMDGCTLFCLKTLTTICCHFFTFLIQLWLYSRERRKSYTSRMGCRWVNNGVIFIVWWTIPLNLWNLETMNLSFYEILKSMNLWNYESWKSMNLSILWVILNVNLAQMWLSRILNTFWWTGWMKRHAWKQTEEEKLW